jgi:hypothetical protein
MQSARPSRYRGIADHLARRDETAVLLTYAEIEVIIGAQLPLAAVINPGWWTTTTHPHVRLWREHGWRASPDRAYRRVRFTRDADAG